MFGSDNLWSVHLEILIVLLTTYLYGIVYPINDLIDFERDRKNQSNKKSILSNSSSKIASLPYLVIYIVVLLVLSLQLPRLRTTMITFVFTVVVLSIVHSLWKFAKPGTLFIERLYKWLSPFVFNYAHSPRTLSVEFLAISVMLFPLIERENYILYMKHKNYSSRMKINVMKYFYTPFSIMLALISILCLVSYFHGTEFNLLYEGSRMLTIIGLYVLWYGLGFIILKISSQVISDELISLLIKDPIYSALLKQLLVQSVMISSVLCTIELWKVQ
jgi:4-hydroxybenzoate polyprenyltransferase